MTVGQRTVVLLLACFAVTAFHRAAAQAGAGVSPTQPSIRLLRSISGPRGSQQNGRYVVEDARSVFYLASDKQIVIYFEFEGMAGKHHFEGFWKNPEGKAVVFSDFTYETPQRRFGAYWKLDLTENVAPGVWSLEAHVDGELAGTHTFQIVAAPRPADSQPARPLLAPADAYKRILEASVFIENLNAQRQPQGRGSGFFIADGLVLTAFEVIDGAASLRLALPDGRTAETTEIAAWDRLQDWALLKVAVRAPAKLLLGAPKSWAVGDRCYSISVPAEGSRILMDESVVGNNAFPGVGERLNVSSPVGAVAAGAPLINEYGEVIGLLATSVYPGARVRDEGAYTVTALQAGGLATPISLATVPPAGAPAKTLSELQAAGQFVPRVTKQEELLYGLLATSFDVKTRDFPAARETKTEFSRKDGRMGVALVWNPRTKLKGEIVLAIYDVYNRTVARTPPSRVKINPGEYFRSVWNLNIAPLHAGGYRVDVLQDGLPIWRTYFRIVE